jgi:microcystin-dependent protein
MAAMEQPISTSPICAVAPRSSGNGPALSATVLGEQIGAESITLTPQQLPAHGVAVTATPEGAGSDQPQRFVLEAAGANVPIEIRAPALALKYCIAVNGIFPARPG